MSKKTTTFKKIFIPFLKLILASALIIYLIQSGKLNFGTFWDLTKDPYFVILSLALVLTVSVVVGALRWLYLLLGTPKHPLQHLGLGVRFQLIGLFFNNFLPGSLGGDVVKAYYAKKHFEHLSFPRAMLVSLLDRVLGFAGLFMLAALFIGVYWTTIQTIPKALPVAYSVMLLGAAFFVFFTCQFFAPIATQSVLKVFVPKKLDPLFTRIINGLKTRRLEFAIALGLTFLNQILIIFYMAYVASLLNPDLSISLGMVAIGYAVGILISAIPIAPAGIGVGHLAFAGFFALVGIPKGADIFNVYLIFTMSVSLLGVIPYLTARQKVNPYQMQKSECS